jgi:hypothetical protein
MEPRREERKDREPRAEVNEAKPRRFRIVKLEERIAPSKGIQTIVGPCRTSRDRHCG